MKKLFLLLSVVLSQMLIASTVATQEELGENYDFIDCQSGDCFELSCQLESKLFDMKIGKLKCAIKQDVCIAFGDVEQGDVLFSYDKREWFTLSEVMLHNSNALTISKYRGI
ncbi:MAG: hypothetical protein H7A40_02340 [Chlamydiales bacterium]|nr:hypothetical protein [Chlamydiales bacterium]